jgi:polysaccharide export outer membrane protein
MLVLSAVCATGCSDSRISIFEFIEMQRTLAPRPTTQPSDRAAEIWSKHAFVPDRVGPSDVLSVALTGLDGPTGTTTFQVRVNRDGEISLPMIDKIEVGDMELEDVERAIEQAYVPSIIKSLPVNVEVVKYDATEVLVVGAVATPGLIPLRRTQRNVFHAVASAGGVSYEASGRMTLRRVRQPNQEVTLNVLDPVELEAAFALPPLESGDIVSVEAAEPSVIYVGGLVNAPGPKLFTPGTKVNLRQILAASGGIITLLEPKEATLIRRMPNGKDTQVKINLGRLQKDEDYPNITLAAGDILWVPETFSTKLLAWAQANLFFRAGVSVTGGVDASYRTTAIDWLNRRNLQKARFGTGGFGGGTLEDRFDPLGSLAR